MGNFDERQWGISVSAVNVFGDQLIDPLPQILCRHLFRWTEIRRLPNLFELGEKDDRLVGVAGPPILQS